MFSENRPQSVALVTCSMARDLELFALLADSVDRHVDESIPHRVVLPKADLPAFRRFETPRRVLVAQEDILPVGVWSAPKALRYLSALKPGFRRPLYLTSSFQVVRGWMLQQFLKIEMTRRAPERAVMHVDSDVAFFRSFRPEDAFRNGRVRYFRVDGDSLNAMHALWVDTAHSLLGLPPPGRHTVHYVENCVLWSRDVAEAMARQVETVQGRPLHEAVFATQTMSEYYLYGVFADTLLDGEELAAEGVSFCNSYWPEGESTPRALEVLCSRLQPKHCAIAMQSTSAIPVRERRALYEWAERGLPA